MNVKANNTHSHDHSFGLDKASTGENRTFIVALLTVVFMVIEISAGVVYGSMALLADGLHMGSHAFALGISVIAYVYARRHARDERFSFGTGKVSSLGGFTGALLLAGFAVVMAWESFERLLNPIPIVFNSALIVAVVGLIVNATSVFILGVHSHDHGDHDHGDHHHHHPDPTNTDPHSKHDHHHQHHDHNHDGTEHADHDTAP
ncbi:MAG: cation diffusion facilitator family transporter, partial [Planctomycetota bacterium]|nr:cation diffusion facilitator family transporter [Planctomycetota bacterium]